MEDSFKVDVTYGEVKVLGVPYHTELNDENKIVVVIKEETKKRVAELVNDAKLAKMTSVHYFQ